MKRRNKMIDTHLGDLTEVLRKYIKDIGYTLSTEPRSSNMTINAQGALVTLPEYIISATAKNPEGMIVSIKLIPSKKGIFIENEKVKDLEDIR
jgi:hypothetical protein